MSTSTTPTPALRKPLSLLVVDDDEGFQHLSSETLREAGYEVDCASSGKAAITWLRRRRADVVLLDLNLPDVQGDEVIRQLRNESRETSFVVVSGCDDGKRIVEMMRHGAHDYLIKNSTVLDLLPNVVARVVTEIDRKKELDEANRRLQESEARFASALAATKDGIWEWAVQPDTFYLSPRWREMLGYGPGDQPLSRSEWEAHIHPEDLERVRQSFLDCLDGTRSRLRAEYRLRDRDGNYRWVLSHGLLHRDDQGRAVRIVGALSDQTERMEMEMQLRQIQKMEAIGRLAGGIAHDFNNILATIQGHLWILEKGEPASHPESRREIAIASQRAATLTRQLLMFSRKQVMQPKNLDLNVLITEMGKMLARSLGEDVKLRLELSGDPSYARVDPGMIEQILLNLAVNARDAMPTGGTLTFSTSAASETELQDKADREPGNYVVLEARDTGCGIPEEVLPRIFEPFFTTKEVGKGTGLGLATVDGIVKQHHGWIEVESHVGQGTLFRIHLPACRKVDIPAPETDNRIPDYGGKETIFLVEDDEAVRVPIRKFLRHLGYTVIEAASGADALTLYDRSRPKIDLLLTDMVMPGGVNGKALGEKMLERLPGLRIIYTSGYDMELITPDMTLEEGFNFLQKPVFPKVMAQTIREALNRTPETSRKTANGASAGDGTSNRLLKKATV